MKLLIVEDQPKTGHYLRQGLTEAGFTTELVADGSPAVSVFLSNGADKPISAEGYKANAILLVNGKTQRFALTPAGDGRLSGTAAEPVPHGVKGVVQITAPNGLNDNAKTEDERQLVMRLLKRWHIVTEF